MKSAIKLIIREVQSNGNDITVFAQSKNLRAMIIFIILVEASRMIWLELHAKSLCHNKSFGISCDRGWVFREGKAKVYISCEVEVVNLASKESQESHPSRRRWRST